MLNINYKQDPIIDQNSRIQQISTGVVYLSSARYAVGRHSTAGKRRFCRVPTRQDNTDSAFTYYMYVGVFCLFHDVIRRTNDYVTFCLYRTSCGRKHWREIGYFASLPGMSHSSRAHCVPELFLTPSMRHGLDTRQRGDMRRYRDTPLGIWQHKP